MGLSFRRIAVLIGLAASFWSCGSPDTRLEIALFAGSVWGVPSGDSYRFIDSAIANYQSLHPEVHITYRSGTLIDDYSEWLAQRIVKGTEPDLYVVLNGDFNTFAAIGALENLDPWIDRSTSFSRTEFYGPALQSGQYQGTQFALPLEVVPNLMFVNSTLLKEAGIAEPRDGWTWEDFYRICDAVTADLDGDKVLDRFGTSRLSWRSLSIANGQLPLDPSGKSTSFGSPSFQETVSFVSKVDRLNRKQDVPSFESGKVAFAAELWSTFRAYGFYPYRVNRFSQFQWEALPMPRGPHGRGDSELLSYQMAISQRSNKKARAWDFLQYLTSNMTAQENMIRYSYGWPALKVASRTGVLEASLSKGFQESIGAATLQTIDSVIENAVVTPRFRKFDEVMATADRELYRIIDDPYNLEDRLKQLDRSFRDSLR